MIGPITAKLLLTGLCKSEGRAEFRAVWMKGREKHNAHVDDDVWGVFLSGMNVISLLHSFSLPQ